jgi:hypothetical protein
MNYLFEKYHVGYLPGHTPDDNQNIIISCFIHPNAIIEMNADIILASKIECVMQILDKKMNEYTMGVNSYDSKPHIFRKFAGLELERPLRFYRSLKCAHRIHKAHEIHRFIQYDADGKMIHQGTIYNGLFTGSSIDSDKKLLNYKDGKINNN